MPLEPRFGVFMSQANKPWSQVLDEFVRAEELGFDTAWLVDHLLDTDGPPEHPCLEAWTLLAAIAAHTSRIRIGVLVTSSTFRHPAILAKQAVTVDHVSGGRLTLGMGTGWHEGEHRRYGIDLPPAVERVDRLAEAVELVVRLMTEPRVTFEAACAASGRDPRTVRRSTWALPAAAASEAAYEAFARRQLELGFTDVSVVPAGVPVERLRRIAETVVPALREEFAPGP